MGEKFSQEMKMVEIISTITNQLTVKREGKKDMEKNIRKQVSFGLLYY